MKENFVAFDSQRLQYAHGLPILSMLISLFGILILDWDFQYLIVLFACEIFLMLAFALVRMFFARNNQPFYETLLQKLFFLVVGIFIGSILIVFSFLIIKESLKIETFFTEIRKIQNQIYSLAFGYFISLFLNYFGNQKYKSAVPVLQLGAFFHVLIILGILKIFTGFVLPNFPNIDQAVWGIVALILVKFMVDLLFGFFQNKIIFLEKNKKLFDN
jgi:hypothetical protein